MQDVIRIVKVYQSACFMQPAIFMWTTNIVTYVACIHIGSVIVHIAIGITYVVM